MVHAFVCRLGECDAATKAATSAAEITGPWTKDQSFTGKQTTNTGDTNYTVYTVPLGYYTVVHKQHVTFIFW